jgi:hypothetical protein
MSRWFYWRKANTTEGASGYSAGALENVRLGYLG